METPEPRLPARPTSGRAGRFVFGRMAVAVLTVIAASTVLGTLCVWAYFAWGPERPGVFGGRGLVLVLLPFLGAAGALTGGPLLVFVCKTRRSPRALRRALWGVVAPTLALSALSLGFFAYAVI